MCLGEGSYPPAITRANLAPSGVGLSNLIIVQVNCLRLQVPTTVPVRVNAFEYGVVIVTFILAPVGYGRRMLATQKSPSDPLSTRYGKLSSFLSILVNTHSRPTHPLTVIWRACDDALIANFPLCAAALLLNSLRLRIDRNCQPN